jgi:hypothetical protein
MMFVSHARTPEELKAEVLSDLRRRIASIDGYSHTVAKSVTEQAKLACATRELEDMFKFWSELEIIRPRRKYSNGMPLRSKQAKEE